MSGIDDQGMRPAGVEQPPTAVPEDGIEEPERASGSEPKDDSDDADLEEVPAGRAGADSGAADTVRVDPDDESEIPDSSTMNDEPGVGPGRGSA